jgi:hypothetical protein
MANDAPTIQAAHLAGFADHAQQVAALYRELQTLQKDAQAFYERQRDLARRADALKQSLHEHANQTTAALAQARPKHDDGPILPHDLIPTPAQERISHLQQTLARACNAIAFLSTSVELRSADMGRIAPDIAYVQQVASDARL